MSRTATFLLTTVGLVALAGGLVLAQQSRCADCHFASPNNPRPNHVSTWDRSPHGRNGVGCEKCHRGDSTT